MFLTFCGGIFEILKKGYGIDTNQSEWMLVTVLEHVSRGSQLNQELSLWLWNCGTRGFEERTNAVKQEGTYKEGPVFEHFNWTVRSDTGILTEYCLDPEKVRESDGNSDLVNINSIGQRQSLFHLYWTTELYRSRTRHTRERQPENYSLENVHFPL